MAVAYYYDHMTKPKQAAYRSMLAGLTELSDSFQLPLLDARELSEVFLQLRLDHPELFWASGFHFLHYQDSPNLLYNSLSQSASIFLFFLQNKSTIFHKNTT